jgi:hypothetical protein
MMGMIPPIYKTSTILEYGNIQRKRYFVPLTLNLISRCYHGYFGRIYNWYQMSKGVTLFTSVKMGDVLAGRSKREVTKGAWRKEQQKANKAWLLKIP